MARKYNAIDYYVIKGNPASFSHSTPGDIVHSARYDLATRMLYITYFYWTQTLETYTYIDSTGNQKTHYDWEKYYGDFDYSKAGNTYAYALSVDRVKDFFYTAINIRGGIGRWIWENLRTGELSDENIAHMGSRVVPYHLSAVSFARGESGDKWHVPREADDIDVDFMRQRSVRGHESLDSGVAHIAKYKVNRRAYIERLEGEETRFKKMKRRWEETERKFLREHNGGQTATPKKKGRKQK